MTPEEGHQQELEARRDAEEYEQFMKDCWAGRDWWYLIDQDTGWIAKVEKNAD